MRHILSIFFVMISLNSFGGEVRMLDNGLKFISIDRDFTETVSVSMFVKGGFFRESLEDSGIGNLFADVWVKSSPLLSKIEFYGGSVSASVSSDYLEVKISTPYENLRYLFEDIRGFFLQPSFNEKIFNTEKLIVLKGIESIKDNPNLLASLEFNKISYGSFPYAFNNAGSVDSVSKISLKDIEQYYKKHLPAMDTVVVVTGKFTTGDIQKLKDIFSRIPKGEKLIINCEGSSIEKSRSAEGTDSKIKQAKLFVGYDAPPVKSGEYIPMKILSDIMGGGMSSLFFDKLRKEKGYAYSVGAYYPSKICNSRWVGYIGLDYKNVKDALKSMEDILSNTANVVTDEKIESVKNYVLGKILTESQTNAKIGWYAGFFETIGLGYDFMDKYVELIRKVTKDDIERASKLLLSKNRVTYVLKPEE